MWYGDYPENVTGSPSKATCEAGAKLLEFYINRVAKDIRAIKEDTVTPALQKEFLKRAKKSDK